METNKLNEILRKHKMWLNDEEGGVRADLTGVNLYGADLDHANLIGANLHYARLYGARDRKSVV